MQFFTAAREASPRTQLDTPPLSCEQPEVSPRTPAACQRACKTSRKRTPASACVASASGRGKCVVRLGDLVVKESKVEHDPVFGPQRPRGLGLFMPAGLGGWTEDLVVAGQDVEFIREADMAPWQREYAMWDIHANDDDYVFVPRTRGIRCVLFRAQHKKIKPSHQLTQVWCVVCLTCADI